jgi:hypothetical protein
MIDPELKTQLERIDNDIKDIVNRYPGKFRSLLNGLMSGFGSVVGIVIAIALIGWLLNTLGYIPAFKSQVDYWKNLLERAQTRQIIESQNQRQ